MKITQTESTIEIKQSGLGQIIAGGITVLIGVAVVIVFLSGMVSNVEAPGWVAPLIGVVMIVFGIFFILMSRDKTIIIEKAGQVIVRTKKLIGGSANQATVPTADVVAVRLSTYIDNTGSTQNRNHGRSDGSKRSTLSLILKNNDTIELGTSTTMVGGSRVNGVDVANLIMKAPLSKEAEQVATFLGVPLQADDTSSLVGAVQSIKNAVLQDNGPSEPASGAAEVAMQPTASPQPQVPQAPPSQEDTSVPVSESAQNQTPGLTDRQ